MAEKNIRYKWNGKSHLVPESYSAGIEEHYPDATIQMRMDDGRVFNVPLEYKQAYIDKYGSKISYFVDNEEEAQPSFAPTDVEETQVDTVSTPVANMPTTTEKDEADDNVTWGDTFVKGGGGLLARVGKKALDTALLYMSLPKTDPETMDYFEGMNYKELINDKSNPVVSARHKLDEVSERLTKEADPTHGEKSPWDLVKEGEYSKAMQKSLAMALESADATLAAYSPYTMILNGVMMAAENYAEETLANPEIDDWKRFYNSVGSAALEQAVEKFADPVFKYFGGKGAKEITETAAKDLIDKLSKEGAENIYKRILRKIGKIGKNTLKDMGGEGIEEIITSAGNDALGMALDAIDGNKDYGIAAQWERFKEQNPDGTKEDFAKAKAGEYWDAFVGGALSSVYMSGTAQTIGSGVNAYSDYKGRKAMEKAYDFGDKMDYADLYDTNTDVSVATDEAVSAFKDEKGNETLSREYLESLSAEDAYYLSRSEELSNEQRHALGKLALEKSTQSGLIHKLDTRLENNINGNKILIDHAKEDNGTLIVAMVNGSPVYVSGGVAKNGRVTAYNGQDGPVMIFDPKTGAQSYVNSKYVTDAVQISAEELSKNTEEGLRLLENQKRETARNTMSLRAKMKAVEPIVKKKVMVDFGSGLTEVTVQEILPQKGEVVIKGKKGDLGGNGIQTMELGVFYDSIARDDDGNFMFSENQDTEVEETVEEVVPETEVDETELTGEEDYRGYEGTIVINGTPINVDNVQQDDPTDTVTYEYTDANGNRRSGSTSISEFKTAIQEAENLKNEPEPQPEVKPEDVVEEPESVTTTEEVVEEAPQTPTDIDWDALFEQDKDAYLAKTQDVYGEEAIDVLNEEIEAAQSELDALNKAKTRNQNERAANRDKKKALKARIEALNGMVASLTPAETVETVEETQPTVEAETAETVTEKPVSETTTETTATNGANSTFEYYQGDMDSMVEESKATPQGLIKKVIAPANERLINDLNNEGIDIDADYNHTIDNSGIRHILKTHGTEKEYKRGQVPVTDDDFKLIEDIVNNYDEIFTDTNKRNQVVITYVKSYPDGTTYYVEEVRVGRKELAADTMYKRKNRLTDANGTETTQISDLSVSSEEVNTTSSDSKDSDSIEYTKELSNQKVDDLTAAPNPVKNPTSEAQKREKSLATQLKRIGISPEQKQDMAFNAGKAVGDFFATREEYESYAENATDLGVYNADFERGVDESFAARRVETISNETVTPEETTVKEEQPMPKPTTTTPTKGAIGRLVDYAKQKISKLISKVSLKDFVATDDIRPAMTGIYHKDGYEYASDTKVLAKIKSEYSSDLEGKIISAKTGKELDVRYPNADDVIRGAIDKKAGELEISVDDIIANAQAIEEIKKGMSKGAPLYVRVGQDLFHSSKLLTAAKMAKQQGLTKVLQQKDIRNRAMAFVGDNGVVLVMSMGKNTDFNILDMASGKITVDGALLSSVKTPATLKGIETARETLEVILPNLNRQTTENLIGSGEIKLVDGKVVYTFPKSDIVKAKEKAKDPNTYNALEDIENNGLIIPMSEEDIANVFAESEDDGILYRPGDSTESDTTDDVEAEMEAIKEKAIKDGTFMKAPNGKPTNLTERQWLQVRTKNFINWFGDWIKRSRIEKLRNSKSIEVKGDEYKGKYELNKKSAFRYINERLKDTYKNEDTGDEIQVSYIGADKVTSHDYNDPVHLASIFHIPQMIKDSIFITEEPNDKNNKKFDSYRYYVCGLNINGEEYTAKIVVGVKGKDTYYDHHLTSIEKGKLIDNSGPVATGLDEDSSAISEVKDKRLISILQNNSSKVVDENGEPRVMYHGSVWQPLNEPDGNAVFKMNDGMLGKGAYFSSSLTEATMYAEMATDLDMTEDGNYGLLQDEYVTDYFLNIRNEEDIFRDGDDIIAVAKSPEQIKSATDNAGLFDVENPDIRFRSTDSPITPEMDAEYMAAVEAGDMETAQRMVLEAAKLAMPDTLVVDENGNPRVVYHGSNAMFTVFDKSRIGSTTGTADGRGFYFTTDRDYAQGFKTPDGQLFDVFLNIENPLSYDKKTITKAQLKEILREADRVEFENDGEHYLISNYADYTSVGTEGAIKEGANLEYDYADNDVELVGSLIGASGSFELIMDAVKKVTGKSGMIAPKDNGTVHYVVTDSAGIKSADPVTYDDNGNVIPLSERFNPKKEDIRYRRSTPLEIHQSSVDEFVSKYNPDTEILVYPINEKTAKMFGYTLKQLKEKHGRYLPSYDFIAIFAREDIMDKQEIEETLFHESIHKIVQFSANEYMISAGKWMFDNASTEEILSDYKKKIEENYADRHDVVKHEEMLTHVLAGAMRHGGTEALMSIVPSDSQKIINEILNAIRYESKAESERRIRETLSQSAVAEDVSESSSEDARQSGRQGYAGTSGRPEDGESGRRVKSDIQNASVDYLAGDERQRAIERAVNEEAAKLGVTVTYKTREEMPRGHKNDKGYFNTRTGEIVVCAENNASINDAIQTILHEAVAHKGLRQLMGDRFDEFINRVYESLDDKTKAKVDALADKHYKGNKAVAMEEYMATLAESEDFAKTSVWEKIKDIFNDIINKILNRDDIKIGDNELRYILRASYANMVNPRNMETIEGWAKDTRMREEYNINEASPEIMSRTGIDPTEIATTTAKEVYDRLVSEAWQEFQRQFQDAMQPVRIAIDAIQQETGNLPIEDYENFILIHNQASSRSRVQIDNFQRRYYNPIVKKVDEIIDMILESRGLNIKDKAMRAEVYKEIRQYMIAKHGLERNAYYQVRKMRKILVNEKEERAKSVREEYKEIVEQIKNDTTLTPKERKARLKEEKERKDDLIKQIREAEEEYDMRDYSGLTALFGMEPDKYVEAEEEAKRVVENFEATIGDDMTEQLWKKIHKATTKTLKHSYECGIISRQQFNEIKGMFQYYIPLRGFDETTAEDVYSYARFEGNRFNPAIAKAEGRTSLADDPLAMIMNMAESEIAQGNKNRAKQALYNFILNRPIIGDDGNQKQNTLMQIESVWYVKDADGTYHLATPDHASGETYEQFENRMLVLAETGEAMKSKKGQVDVGLRFQKPDNKNSHYIYLRVNGVEKAIYVNGDPKVANAVNGKSGEPLGEFGQKMKTVNRFLSSTFTNYSLEFTARNYFRDMLYSHINIDIKEPDPAYRKKFRQNWRHNNLRSMMKMLKAYRAGEYDVRGRALTEDEIAFVKFMENGGQTGYTLLNSVETHKRDLEKAIERMRDGIDKGGVKDSTVFKATLGGIELLNEVSELVTRFAAFKTSMDMGRSVVKSINDAKEITVNFNTKGAQDGSGWFGMLSRYFSCSKFFFNASVQGVQNVKAMAEANKLKFCVTSCGIIAFGFTMPIITAAIQELFGGDDDENEYWLIPEYERQNNFCVCLGNGKYVKIPLPIGFRELYAMGDMVAAMVFDKKFKRDYWQVGTDMANKIASMVLPINPLQSQANGLSIMETVAYTVAPSSAQVIIQTITNTDWKGAPLQKEYTYNANDPHWMKAYSNNPMWMRMLSKWCEEHINEGDYVGLNWSPEYLDNGLSNLFGGVYSLIKKTGNLISSAWNEEQRTLANVPLVSVVLGSGIDSDEKFINGAYYDEKEYYDKRIGKIKRHAEAFGYTLDEVFYKKKGELQPAMMKEIYNKRDFDFMQEYYKGHFGDPEGKTKEDRAGLNKLKREIDSLKKEINKDPSSDKLGKLIEMQNKYDSFRKDLVNDLLELD